MKHFTIYFIFFISMLFISFPIYGQFVVDRPGLINPPDILQENKVQ